MAFRFSGSVVKAEAACAPKSTVVCAMALSLVPRNDVGASASIALAFSWLYPAKVLASNSFK